MLQLLPTPFEWQMISSCFEQINGRNEIVTIRFNPAKDLPIAPVETVVCALEGDFKQVLQETFHIKVIHLYEFNTFLLYEPAFHFNRYRLITLRDEFYDEHTGFNVPQFKTYCRTKEQEALKAGLQADIWDMKAAHSIFGASEEAGYFGGKGSNGWKFIALANYLTDLFFTTKRKSPCYRFTPYDTLMKDGKLVQLNQLLKSRDSGAQQSMLKFFIRKMHLKEDQFQWG